MSRTDKLSLVLIFLLVRKILCSIETEFYQLPQTKTPPEIQAKEAHDVIHRLVPQHSHLFQIRINRENENIENKLNQEAFKLYKDGSLENVSIEATSGVTACKAFYYYIKIYCKCHVSWEGSQLSLPKSLPNVNISITSPNQFVYYQNVCTWSYSFSWWNWNDWRKHIDWMALNGITLTLAPVQEKIWREVYYELGLTKDEIDDHFAGSGFLAWQRMGNIRGWGGPLSDTYINYTFNLQLKMINALRNLGIVVALPAFAGHVPVAFKRVYPNSTLTYVEAWNKFPVQYCCPLFIEPTESLFSEIGELFLRKIIAAFGGTNHIYFSDPYNEIQPRIASAEYLSNASRAIYETMKKADEHAVWLLQGWMFVKNALWNETLIKSFLTAVPLGKIIVLDLQSEQYPQYERTKSIKISVQYCCPLFIEPTESLFSEIGELFLRKIIAAFGGTNHIYFSDPYNEIQPRIASAEYLSNASRAIYETMKKADEHAVWLLQGWMFVKNSLWNETLIKSFLTAVPLGKIIVLDLQSEQYPQYERTKSFYGQPFIWCMLHNFGGTLGMHGSIDIVNQRILDARRMKNSSMIGIGITPEGINQNYVIYEFALERGWQENIIDVSEWISNYSICRYGTNNTYSRQAWQILKDTVYSYKGEEKISGKYLVCRRPTLKLTPLVWYNVTHFDSALEYMIMASDSIYLKHNKIFQYDIVDITRQFLQNKIDTLYSNLLEAYKKQDIIQIETIGMMFLDILLDMDRILATNSEFLLGKWLERAKAFPANHVERRLHEINARNQITIWGPSGQIVDYAMKQWSGMILDYCRPRWNLFFGDLINKLNNTKSNDIKFNENKFKEKVFKLIEKPFTVDDKIYTTEPVGDTINVAQFLYHKWKLK